MRRRPPPLPLTCPSLSPMARWSQYPYGTDNTTADHPPLSRSVVPFMFSNHTPSSLLHSRVLPQGVRFEVELARHRLWPITCQHPTSVSSAFDPTVTYISPRQCTGVAHIVAFNSPAMISLNVLHCQCCNVLIAIPQAEWAEMTTLEM